MLKGIPVIIQEANVVNGHLVRNWGTLVREEFGGKVTMGVQNTKATTLQDVRTVGDDNIYSTHADKVRFNFDSFVIVSSGLGSAYGGSINNLANANIIVADGDRSSGDPN